MALSQNTSAKGKRGPEDADLEELLVAYPDLAVVIRLRADAGQVLRVIGTRTEKARACLGMRLFQRLCGDKPEQGS
jgi:hypothetical protein